MHRSIARRGGQLFHIYKPTKEGRDDILRIQGRQTTETKHLLGTFITESWYSYHIKAEITEKGSV
jgi:hypothetical protein